MLPEASTVTPLGSFSFADVAEPLSPLNPPAWPHCATPAPATVEILPAEIFLTLWLPASAT